MYLILCVLCLVAGQAFGVGDCLLSRTNCFRIKLRDGLRGDESYQECLNIHEVLKIGAKYLSNMAQVAIARKMCDCILRQIVEAMVFPIVMERAHNILCLSEKDVFLPNCPRRARECLQHFRNFTDSMRKRHRYVMVGSLQQCIDKEKLLMFEINKCISEAKNGCIDLSGCGSIKPFMELVVNVPYVAKFVCSGCDIITIIKDCFPVERPTPEDMCNYLLNDTMLLEYITCVKRNMSTSPSCCSVSLPAAANMLSTIRTNALARLATRGCLEQRKVIEVYNSWNCTGNTITRKKREMKNYDLLDLLAEFLQLLSNA